MDLPKRILVPTDFSETSTRALDYAIELARATRGSVVLLHVYEIPVFGFPDGALIATADIAARISSAAQVALDELKRTRVAKDVPIDVLLRQGVPDEEVSAVAESEHADLIVIGTHGRKGIARALLGSVAENIIRTAHLPVLTIHGPRK